MGIVITILSIFFLFLKLKNRNLICEYDDFYEDEDEFYEDYHALDYEEDEE